MKKILLSTLVLLFFSLSIIIFQISCKKPVDAATPNNSTISQQNKIVFQKDFYGSGLTATPYDHAEIWTANYDGTNQQKLNVDLPSGVVIVLGQAIKVSPDGKTLFFTGFAPGNNYPTTSTPWSIYSCNIDGSNVRLVISGTKDAGVETDAAF